MTDLTIITHDARAAGQDGWAMHDYMPSSEAERVAAEEWRNEQRRDAYLYRRDSYERAACVVDDYDSGPDWRQAEEIEEQRWHEEHGNDEH